jgi:hypothetical protein
MKKIAFLLIISVLFALVICACSTVQNTNETAVNKTETVSASVAETAEASSDMETTVTKAMENTEQHGIITDDDDLEIMTLPQTESVEDTQALTEETYEVTTAPASAETKPAERETYIELPFVPAV